MNGAQLPGSDHLQRHGGEDLHDHHVHEVQRHRRNGLGEVWVVGGERTKETKKRWGGKVDEDGVGAKGCDKRAP